MNHAIEAIGLSKQYNSHYALQELNLAIEPGEIFCLLGQNGAGKTTTINLFLGFVPASAGKAMIKGVEVTPDGNDTRKWIAYIPEVVQLYSHLSALENLDYFARLAGYRYSASLLAGFLQKTGLEQSANTKRLSTFSKGMRQKVAIAIALAKNADVILMDEPTSGLDPAATAEFSRICRELASQGKTILMATHDLFNAVNLGSRIGIMRRGQLVHVLETRSITANELQQLYLETI